MAVQGRVSRPSVSSLAHDVDSFEELGLAPELVEALAADGLEQPTSLQAEALPVIRRRTVGHPRNAVNRFTPNLEGS